MKERAEAGRLPKGEEEQRRNVPKKARTPCVDFLNADIPAKAPLPKELRLQHKRHPLVSVPTSGTPAKGPCPYPNKRALSF
jgi:hypothetical protein